MSLPSQPLDERGLPLVVTLPPIPGADPSDDEEEIHVDLTRIDVTGSLVAPPEAEEEAEEGEGAASPPEAEGESDSGSDSDSDAPPRPIAPDVQVAADQAMAMAISRGQRILPDRPGAIRSTYFTRQIRAPSPPKFWQFRMDALGVMVSAAVPAINRCVDKHSVHDGITKAHSSATIGGGGGWGPAEFGGGEQAM